MKKLILLFILALVSYVSFAQSKYVLIYKSESTFKITTNHALTPAVIDTSAKETIYSEHSVLFDSLSEVMEFLNSRIDGLWSIKEKDIVGIFDLTSAKKVKVKLKIEKKSQPRQVVIEEKTWEEKEYVIDNR